MGNKRDFLKKLSLLTVGGVVGSSMTPVLASEKSGSGFFASKKIMGLQIYSLGKELTDNVPVGMKKIAEIGYQYIELAGYGNRKMGEYGIVDYKKIVNDAGLKITSSHVNPPVRKYSPDNIGQITDYWKQTVEDHVKLGVSLLVQPGMPSIETPDDAKYVGEVFNKAGEIAKSAGIKWGYHNHNMEFKRVQAEAEKSTNSGQNDFFHSKGEVVYDLLLNSTDPSLVFFEMDVYWTVMGQNDPVEYMEKYPTRIQALHIKDREVLGESGMMNFETIFKKAYSIGIKNYFVELEKVKGNITQFEGVKQCLDYLNKVPFVK